MIEDPHTGFILAAYAVAGVVVAAMIAAAWLDYRRLMRALTKFKDDRDA
ncbi:heme exporter protein CcmD [Methylovirgula sp. 4M-Z18]|nr:heme exporter protein CcmD [Methylovirgula sp. 4M-Z18]RFB78532.1 heme exporter protein CcmD [Methylovirgula sp. 4M-Z18]